MFLICGFCGKREVFHEGFLMEDVPTAGLLASDVMDSQWTYLVSQEYAQEGLACPDCAREYGTKGEMTDVS